MKFPLIRKKSLQVQMSKTLGILENDYKAFRDRKHGAFVDHGTMKVAKIRSKFLQSAAKPHFSRYKIRFVDNLLKNETIILLNLAEYRLILANSAYGLVG